MMRHIWFMAQVALACAGALAAVATARPAAHNGSAHHLLHPAACPSPYALEGFCAAARDVSVGNCLACVGNRSRGACTPAEMDTFCGESSAPTICPSPTVRPLSPQPAKRFEVI